MLTFKKYSRDNSAELKELGTVKSLCGKGGSFRFSKKNFTSKRLNKSGNRIALIAILQQKNGNSAMVVCSQQVSELVRAGEMTSNQFLGLPVIEVERENDETGKMELVHYITLPQGAETDAISADQETDEFENSADFLPDNFITA